MNEVEGARYGRLVILKRSRVTDYGHWMVEVECDCGTQKEVKLYHITSGKIQSCGCLNAERLRGNHRAKPRHGKTGTRVYRAWQDMHQRCKSKQLQSYYKDRGIVVCDRWNKFENFYEDMGETPEGATLDRINNDGDYEPGNCRWTTRYIQSANTRLLRVTNTSGYRGVGWHKQRQKWRAYIQVHGKLRHLGLFSDIKDAARAYNAVAETLEGYPLNEVN